MHITEIRRLEKEIQAASRSESKESPPLKIVDSHVLTGAGNYDLAIEKAALDEKTTKNIVEIAEKHNLKVSEMDQYLIISKPQ